MAERFTRPAGSSTAAATPHALKSSVRDPSHRVFPAYFIKPRRNGCFARVYRGWTSVSFRIVRQVELQLKVEQLSSACADAHFPKVELCLRLQSESLWSV